MYPHQARAALMRACRSAATAATIAQPKLNSGLRKAAKTIEGAVTQVMSCLTTCTSAHLSIAISWAGVLIDLTEK
jgi:hypothetical protein